MHPRGKIQIGGAGFVLAMAGALFLPQRAASGSEGLAAAGTAALAFLSGYALALGFALYVLVVTVRQRAHLTTRLRVAGLVPVILWLIGLVVMACAVRASSQSSADDQVPQVQTTAHGDRHDSPPQPA